MTACAAAVALCACGAADDPAGAPVGPTLVPVATTVAATTQPPTTPPPSTAPASRPHPDEVAWLAPLSTPSTLRLVEARRALTFGCGEGDCDPTVPGADLVYDTSDLAFNRSARVTQIIAEPGEVQLRATEGEPVNVGGRAATVQGFGSAVVTVSWTEPSGIVVTVNTVGLTSEDLDTLVGALRPLDPSRWPGAEVSGPVARCVDESSRAAPVGIPEGWKRFVLEVHPTGTCGVATYLWMSLVEPGTADGPGTLVNFVITPASVATPQPGQPITVNGRPATMQTTTGPDGRTQSSIDMQIGTAVVNGHGDVSPELLTEFMSSVALVDDSVWETLLSEAEAAE